MGKEAAVLLIRVKADAAEARKELKNVYAIAGNEAKTFVRQSTLTNRQMISLDEARAKSAARVSAAEQKASRESLRTLSLHRREAEREYDRQAKAAQKAMAEVANAYKKVEREEQRRSRSSRAGFISAVMSSRYALPGSGGNIMPLVGQTMQSGAAGLAGIAAVGAVSAASSLMKRGIEQAAELEQSLNILKSQSGATEEEMNRLAAAARALGGDLTLPATSSADAAKAMLELSKAGLSVDDTLRGARGTLQLAAAANIEVGEAANIVATQLKAFSLSGSDATRVADLLAAAANNSLGEITDMAQAAQQSSAVFAQAKIPVEDMTTAISLMANAGVKGSDAGTSLKTMLVALMAPTKEAKSVMDALGIAVYDQQGRMRPLRDIINNVTQALIKLTPEQRDFALKTMLGTDAIRAGNIVLAAGITKFDTMKRSVTEAGAAAKAAEARTEGLKGAMEGLNSQLDTLSEKRAAPVLNFLTNLVKTGSGALDLFDSLLDTTKNYNSELDRLADKDIDAIMGKGALEKAQYMMGEFKKVLDIRNSIVNSPENQRANLTSERDTISRALSHFQGGGELLGAKRLAAMPDINALESSSFYANSGGKFDVTSAEGRRNLQARLGDIDTVLKRLAYTDGKADPYGSVLRGAYEAQGERNRATGGKPGAGAALDALRAKKGRTRSGKTPAQRAAEAAVREASETEQLLLEGNRLRAETAAEAAQRDFQSRVTSFGDTTSSTTMGRDRTALRALAGTLLARQQAQADEAAKKAGARLPRDNAQQARARAALAEAEKQQAYNKAQDEYRARLKQIDDAHVNAKKRINAYVSEQADKELERLRNDTEKQKAFLDTEEFELQERKQRAELANSALSLDQQEQDAKTLFDIQTRRAFADRTLALKALATLAEKEYRDALLKDSSPAGVAAAKAAQIARMGVGSATINTEAERRVSEATLGRDVTLGGIAEDRRTVDLSNYGANSTNGGDVSGGSTITLNADGSYSVDKNGKTRTFDQNGSLKQSLGTLADGAKQAGANFISAIVDGRAKDALGNLINDSRKAVAESITDYITDKYVNRPLDAALDKATEGMDRIGKGMKMSAMEITAAGYGLLAALGQQGKRKQGGAILGALAGLAVGSLLPGVSLVQGLAYGSAAGAMFTPRAGGGPMLPGRSYLFEGNRPEIVTMGANGMGFATGSAREVGGRAVTLNYVHEGDINDRADRQGMMSDLGATLEDYLNRGGQ